MNNIFFPGEVLEISENKYNYLPNCTEYVTSELTKNSINVSILGQLNKKQATLKNVRNEGGNMKSEARPLDVKV